MEIRHMRPEDDSQIAGIVRKNLEDKQLAIPGTAYFDEELDHLSEFFRNLKNGAYWVLEDDQGQVAGGVGIAPYDGTVAELQKLYLKDESKGRGYGKMLLDHALNYAAIHYDAVYLETFAALEEANQLYLKKGFRQLSQPFGANPHNACDTWFMKQLC